MGKNNRLINSINAIAKRKQDENVGKAADQMVPQIYAAMAMALHRTHGFDYDQINAIFIESQHIWDSFNGKIDEMVDLCEKETGVTVVFKNPEEQE